MGHYAGEMGYGQVDRYNYQKVNRLGFESVYTDTSSADIKRCPRCLCLVEGEYAERHMEMVHQQSQEVRYYEVAESPDPDDETLTQTGKGERYVTLAYPEGLSMAATTLAFSATDEDGTKRMVIFIREDIWTADGY